LTTRDRNPRSNAGAAADRIDDALAPALKPNLKVVS
jgi:hypothetical protein